MAARPILAAPAESGQSFDTSGGFYQNPYKIYGCLLTRVTAARLTHGIRGVLWHQGENDSGSGAPTGDWNYKSYQQYFIDMAAAWKQDYPNIQHYYVFQVWPLAREHGSERRPDTRGPADPAAALLQPVDACPPWAPPPSMAVAAGAISIWKATRMFARFMSPLVEQDNYGLVPTTGRHRAGPQAGLVH